MRLGIHRMTGRADNLLMGYYEQVQPEIIKLFEPGEDANALAGELKRRFGTLSIGREYFEDQPIGGSGLKRNIARVVALARQHQNIDAWELYNECYNGPDEMGDYAAASIEFMEAMRAIGKVAIIGCFSQGTPEVLNPAMSDEQASRAWAAFRPALEHAMAHGHGLGIHEYSGPFMDFEDTWHVRRYLRHIATWNYLGLNTDRLKIYVTEHGIDDVWERPGPQGRGYKPFQGSEWDRPPNSKHGDYAGQLLWSLSAYSAEPRIKGVCEFGFATASDDWVDFDLSTDPVMLSRIAILQRQIPKGGAPVESLDQVSLQVGARNRKVPYTPGNALFDAMTRDGYGPAGPEEYFDYNGKRYTVQPAAKGGSPNRVYRAAVGDWGHIDFVQEVPAVKFLWPCGEPERERHGVGLPAGWTIATKYDQVYDLAGKPTVHPGLDINGPGGGDSDLGKAVYAIGDGTVVSSQPYAVWGNIVLVRHDGVPGYGRLWSQYAHLKNRLVRPGDSVRMGQQIGTIGKGAEDRYSAHLHFEIRSAELGADYWPAAGGRSLAEQHALVERFYVNPIGLLGTA